MNVRRYWPGYALLLTAAVGAIAGGIGGAVVTLTLALLVVGPGYLIQERVRRRHGAAPSGRGLDREANEALDALALRYLTLVNRSRLVRLGVFAGSTLLVAVIWVVFGRGWAIAAVGYSVLTAAVSIVRVQFRRRH
jgi:hypothetical protein